MPSPTDPPDPIDPSPAPARADAQRNRRRVLEAVLTSAGEVRELSLDEIARRAGVGRSTLFRHFATREELLLAATAQAIEEGQAIARAAIADGDSAADVFTRLSRDIARLAARFRVLRGNRELAARLIEREGDDPLLEWVAAAHARGELRQELSPRWIADMLIVLAMASADQLREPGREEAEVAAMLAATLIGAFVAPRADLRRRQRDRDPRRGRRADQVARPRVRRVGREQVDPRPVTGRERPLAAVELEAVAARLPEPDAVDAAADEHPSAVRRDVPQPRGQLAVRPGVGEVDRHSRHADERERSAARRAEAVDRVERLAGRDDAAGVRVLQRLREERAEARPAGDVR